MSDLDDLAAAAQSRQQVPVRRRSLPAVPEQRPLMTGSPVIYVAPSPPPAPPRSAFMAGFYGTFGVIAAVIVIMVGLTVWGMVSASIVQARENARLEELRSQRMAVEEQRRLKELADYVPPPIHAPGGSQVQRFADSVQVTAEVADANHLILKAANVTDDSYDHIKLTVTWKGEMLAEQAVAVRGHGEFVRTLEVPGVAAKLGGHSPVIVIGYLP